MLVRLAAPVALAGAGYSAMNVVGSAIVGRSGTVALAAFGLSHSIFFTLSILAVGLMMGLDPLISQAFGAGEQRRARELVWQGAWMALIAGAGTALLAAVAPFALDWSWVGIEPEVAATTRWCIWARLPCLPFLLIFYPQRSYLTAAGWTWSMLAASLVANLLNAGLTWLLVYGGQGLSAWGWPFRWVPAMGAPGASLAMALSLMAVAGMLALLIRRVPLDDTPPPRRPSPAELVAAAQVGLPVGLHMAAEIGVFTLVGILAGRLGRVPLAAHQIALTFASLSFTLAVGIGNAGTVRVGWAIGARDTRQARRSGLIALATGGSAMAVWALIFLLFPAWLGRLMTHESEVIAAAVPLLAVAAVFQISDGIQGVGAGVLRGAADTRFTFAANVFGHWAIGLPIAWLLGFKLGWGITGLWWGLCLGLTLVAVSLLVRFARISSREIVPVALRQSGPAPTPPGQASS